MATGDLYRILSRYEIVGKIRQSVIAITAVLSADILLLFCLFSLDNILNFNTWIRIFFLVVIVVSNLSMACWIIYLFAFRKESSRNLAMGFEKENGVRDNSIINAVCFDADGKISPSIKSLFIIKASENCRKIGIRVSTVFRTRNFIVAARVLVVAILIFGIYSAIFHRHVENALFRFINPYSQLASLNYTQFNVLPGDIEMIEGDSCRISSSATRGGETARELSLVVNNQDSVDSYEMQRDNNGFSMELKNVTTPVRYSVRSRHESSRWFAINVVRKPRFESVTVSVKPPEYTGEKEYPLQLKRNNEILKDSLLKVSSVLSLKLKSTFSANGRILPDTGSFEYRISTSSVLKASVKNEKGMENRDAWTAEFTAVDDRVPEIRFLNTNMNIELLPGEKVPIQLLAEDDIAVKSIDIYVESPSEEKVLKSFRYEQNRKSLREVWTLTADKSIFATNSSYKIMARVSDNFPGGHVGVTQIPLNVHIVDNAKILAEIGKNDAEGKLYSFLMKALEKQKELQNQLGGRIKNIKVRNELAQIDLGQNEVHKLIESASGVAGELRKSNRITPSLQAGIDNVKNGISAQILGEFKDAFTERKKEDVKITLNKIILMQGQLIANLEELLNLMALGKKEMEAKKDEAKEELQDLAMLDKLKALKKDLDKFKEEQKAVIEKTEELDKKNPEDWTKKDEELLGDLSAKELDLSKFFKAAFNDLSKLGRQDFSNSKMAEELVSMYEELQKAGDAVKKKQNIEIATLNEESAMVAAETVEQNLERWLADQQDNIKWNAEQGEGSPDVQLTDLPNELTDIIGDLIESEKDMGEDSQDSTNSTAWDKDEGLGWGVSDGNINSMQAKGITGNVLPNNNEVQGRSGEGRSGKSSGQFVGNTAVGKGGRDTPTRLTESPFEEGTIKDTSKEAQGGSTGGGKQSGIGHEGLRGKTPDNNRDLEQRLPNQVELKQKAEALLRKLTVQNLPTGDLEDAISKMELLSKYNAKGKGLELRQAREDLLSSLIDAKTAVREAVKSDIDKNSAKNKKGNFFKYSGNEKTPSGYEDTVEAYFKSLAEGEE